VQGAANRGQGDVDDCGVEDDHELGCAQEDQKGPSGHLAADVLRALRVVVLAGVHEGSIRFTTM
jgi:hypothetical protein